MVVITTHNISIDDSYWQHDRPRSRQESAAPVRSSHAGGTVAVSRRGSDEGTVPRPVTRAGPCIGEANGPGEGDDQG